MDIKWRVCQYRYYHLRMEGHDAAIEAVTHECDKEGNRIERTVAFDDKYVDAQCPEKDAGCHDPDSWKRENSFDTVRVWEYWYLSEEEVKRRFRTVNRRVYVYDMGLAIEALRSIGVYAAPADRSLFDDEAASKVASGKMQLAKNNSKFMGKSGCLAVSGTAPLLMRAHIRPHRLFKAWEAVCKAAGMPYSSEDSDEAVITMEAAREIAARPEVKALMRITLHDLLNNESNGVQTYILKLRKMYYIIVMDSDNTGRWYRVPRSILQAADENATDENRENALYWRFRLYNEASKALVMFIRAEYAGVIARRLVSKTPEPVTLDVSEELMAINAGIEPMSEEHVFVLPLHNHRFRRYQAAIYAAFAENEIVLGHDENEMYSILNELMKSEILVNSDKLVAFVDEDCHFSYFAFLTDDGYRWFRVPSYIGCQWAKGVVEAGGRVYNTVCFIEDIIDADVDREDDEDNKEGETWYVPVLNEMLNEYYERVEEEDGDE